MLRWMFNNKPNQGVTKQELLQMFHSTVKPADNKLPTLVWSHTAMARSTGAELSESPGSKGWADPKSHGKRAYKMTGNRASKRRRPTRLLLLETPAVWSSTLPDPTCGKWEVNQDMYVCYIRDIGWYIQSIKFVVWHCQLWFCGIHTSAYHCAKSNEILFPFQKNIRFCTEKKTKDFLGGKDENVILCPEDRTS